MNSLFLKIIALVLMTLDHVGLVFLNNNNFFRLIGRAAFPIYSFLLVIGFMYTKDNKKRLTKYFISLFIFAVLSELIHDISLFNSPNYFFSQNIMFTLLFALICMTVYEKNSKCLSDKIISILIVLLIACISQILFFEYGVFGVLLIFMMYIIKKINVCNKVKKMLFILLFVLYVIIVFITNNYYIPTFGVLFALIPILMYNGKKGYKSLFVKYFFYTYYPLHLLIIYLLK